MDKRKGILANLILLTLGIVAVVHILPSNGTFSLKNLIARISGPCTSPIEYRVGQIDPRFNISASTFLTDIDQAANIWNSSYGKTLFTYNSEGELAVNLVYDSRQTLDTQINNLQSNVQNQKGNLDQQISQYESLVVSFNSKVSDFENQIKYWNSRGGAPPDVYSQLIQQQKNLSQEANKLNLMAAQLNQSTVSYNTQVGTLNQTINEFNTALSLKPEEGLYDPKTDSINIYFTSSQPELIHMLAHELGHALGLQHNPNNQSIMYPYATNTQTPTQDDLRALKTLCGK